MPANESLPTSHASPSVFNIWFDDCYRICFKPYIYMLQYQHMVCFVLLSFSTYHGRHANILYNETYICIDIYVSISWISNEVHWHSWSIAWMVQASTLNAVCTLYPRPRAILGHDHRWISMQWWYHVMSSCQAWSFTCRWRYWLRSADKS